MQVATDQPAVRCSQADSHSSTTRWSPRGLSQLSRPRKSARHSVTSLPTFTASSARTWAFSSSSVASEDREGDPYFVEDTIPAGSSSAPRQQGVGSLSRLNGPCNEWTSPSCPMALLIRRAKNLSPMLRYKPTPRGQAHPTTPARAPSQTTLLAPRENGPRNYQRPWTLSS